MVLSYKYGDNHIPRTSACIITSIGTLKDGDKITITSPIFASINFKSRGVEINENCEVTLKISGNKINSNGELVGKLICEDNDPFNMYVEL